MRTILQTLMRYKTSTILNIVGLSIAFAACIVIGMQIRYELSYNKHYDDHEQIYLLAESRRGEFEVGLPLPTAVMYRGLPSVEKIGWTNGNSSGYETKAEYVIDGNEQSAKCMRARCDSEFFGVFGFQILQGDLSSFNNEDVVVISDKYAKQLFGDKSPIGENVSIEYPERKDYTIVAVYESHGSNTSVEADVYMAEGEQQLTNVYNYSFDVYAKLKKGVSVEQFEKEATVALQKHLKAVRNYGEEKVIPVAVAITDVMYKVEGRSRNTLYIMMAIALVVMLVGFINFINFAVSTIPLKMKNINLRRVVGATKTELRVSLILTDVVLVVVSFLIGTYLVQMVKTSPFAGLIDDTSFKVNIIVYALSLVAAITIGVLAGLYPAFYSTSFSPSLMLKGRFLMGVGGVRLRKVLIVFQYFVAITFIAVSMFIALQQNFLINIDGGYIKEGIIKVDQEVARRFKNWSGLKEELMSHAQIKDVAFGNTNIGLGNEGGAAGSISNVIDGVEHLMDMAIVSPNFMDFFGIEMLEGRHFGEGKAPVVIANKVLVDKYGYKLGQQLPALPGVELVGICENVNMLNMRKDVLPVVYHNGEIKYPNMGGNYSEVYIKVSGNSKEIFDHIKKTYAEIAPEMDVEVNYFTDVLANVYGDENRTKQMMMGFSLLSIIIALVGVFGLMSFDTRFRRKEISLRKINGATIKQIILMFTMSYLKIVAVAFVLSVPVVYYAVSEWLKGFAYKIELSWWVFAVALLLVVLLTLIIALVQCYKAASENPINSLKDE